MFVTTLLHFVKHFISKTRNYVRNCSQTPFPLITTDRFSMLLPKLTLSACWLPSSPTHTRTSLQPILLSLSYTISFCLPVFPCCVETLPPNRKERKRNQQKQILTSFLPLAANLISLLPFIASFSKEFLIFPSSVLVLIFLLLNRKMYIL